MKDRIGKEPSRGTRVDLKPFIADVQANGEYALGEKVLQSIPATQHAELSRLLVAIGEKGVRAVARNFSSPYMTRS